MSSKIGKQSGLQECQIPSKFINLVPHLVEDFCRLRRNALNSQTKVDCDWKLANNGRKKCSFTNDGSHIRQIEIELCEDPALTAEEKMALPQTRKLEDLKKHPVYPEFSRERKKTINRLIKKSEQSESKQINLIKNLQRTSSQIGRNFLANSKNNRSKFSMKPTRRPSNEWRRMSGGDFSTFSSFQNGSSKNEFSNNKTKLKMWLEQRKAIHKTYGKLLKQREDASREVFQRLSKPKKDSGLPTRMPWTLTSALRKYTPSERLTEISLPKKNLNPYPAELNTSVKKSALQYNASTRIAELATPIYFPTSNYDPFKVSRGALLATPSARVTELATPRQRVDRMNRKNPFHIPRRALYARTTRHIRELAQPKVTFDA